MDATAAGRWRGFTVMTWLLGVIAAIAAGFVLKAAKIVVMPLAFAFFIVILVYPLQKRLDRSLLRRWRKCGVAVTMSVILLAFALFSFIVWLSAAAVTEKLPEYIDRLTEYWHRFSVSVRQYDARLGAELRLAEGKAGGSHIAGKALSSLARFLEVLTLVFFLVLLMLIEFDEWKVKLGKVFAGRKAGEVLDTVRTIAAKVRKYLLVHTIISLISGTAAALWLFIMGVDFALMWGLLTALLNFIPYIGSVIAVVPPSLIALIQLGPTRAAAVLAGLGLIDQILGNYIDPRLQGEKLIISPTILLLSIVFWAWVWGAAGALLAVPMTVTIIVICDHVPPLKPIAQLLGRT